MMKNFIEELRWRGMLHNNIPGTQEHLSKKMRSAYIGFDPTADSLHIGNLVPIMLLSHYQRCGHKPVVLVGGATGMIGDPSGKSAERNLLDEKTLRHNQEAIKRQLAHFLDFESDKDNVALLLNNYDWMKDFSFLDFIRQVGKHLTINYMIAKDSVKNRIKADAKEGMSFTEFSYQILQGYDFFHLNKTQNTTLQMGGSDQWGNITTGTELIRRMSGKKGYAVTCPLITKSDGAKFGKSEAGNIWLDANRTSPYKFYQYWLNISDVDAEKYIKIFTFLDKSTIDSLVLEHQKNLGMRLLQKRLGQEITVMVHGEEAYQKAIQATQILFGKSTEKNLKSLEEKTFLEVFNGVPQALIQKKDITKGLPIIETLSEKTHFFSSKGAARRALIENAISVNKEKITVDFIIKPVNLIAHKYVLLQRGKKHYFLIKVKN